MGKLSYQELEVVKWAVAGLSNEEIATKLSIAPLTVTTHLRNIYKKLSLTGASNPRMRLVNWYYFKQEEE